MPKIVYEVQIIRTIPHSTKRDTYWRKHIVPRSHSTSVGIDLHGLS